MAGEWENRTLRTPFSTASIRQAPDSRKTQVIKLVGIACPSQNGNSPRAAAAYQNVVRQEPRLHAVFGRAPNAFLGG